jgi:hypothetical protein
LHVATIHHRVPEVTQITNRRHPGRQLTLQFLSDDRVQLFIAEPGDAIQGTHLAVRNKMTWVSMSPGRTVAVGNRSLARIRRPQCARLDTDDLSPIEKNRRSSVAELSPCEHS